MPKKSLELPSVDDRKIWDVFLSYNIYPAVCASEEIGLFSLLNERPLWTDDVATALEISRDWAEVLLGILASEELIRLQDGKFHLTEVSKVYLLPESPFFKGPLLRQLRDEGRIERTVKAVRGSNPRADNLSGRIWKAGEMTLEHAESRSQSMHSISFPAAMGMAKNGDFKGVRRLLDVAGGSGGFSIALALRHADIHCTIAELPMMCIQARKMIADYGVEDQVDTLELNMFSDQWPSGYDAMFFSNVLHDWDYVHRAQLIKSAFDALPSGGRIYVHEMLMTDGADGPPGPALFNFGMLLGTWGKQFTAPEMRKHFEEAGFRDVTFENTYGYFSLSIGRKP
jgi:cyclopropane fatty-acyl-phospholipid synthase-like methyltransferase